MNTNSNIYTLVYTAVIVIVVAALLTFASLGLKSRQDANIKAETISQMLSAAQISSKEALSELSNEQILGEYAKYAKEAYTIDYKGNKLRDLAHSGGKVELADGLKAQNSLLKKGKSEKLELPVYVFSSGGRELTVVPVYGAGLWGPVWGYLAFEPDMKTLAGAYFDHESETPGLGAKIKDDPGFREAFKGKRADFGAPAAFEILKGAQAENAVDAITGATMTSRGLGEAIASWLEAYKPFFAKASAPIAPEAAADSTLTN